MDVTAGPLSSARSRPSTCTSNMRSNHTTASRKPAPAQTKARTAGRYSLDLSMQMERWASSTACLVASPAPESASAAALALSPACSSSTTASRASFIPRAATLRALTDLPPNSRTTAASTGDAAASCSTAATATETLAPTSSSWSCTLGMASAGRDLDLVLQNGEDLLSQLWALGVPVGRHRMLGSSLEHLALGARDRQRAAALAGKVPTVGNLAAHDTPSCEDASARAPA